MITHCHRLSFVGRGFRGVNEGYHGVRTPISAGVAAQARRDRRGIPDTGPEAPGRNRATFQSPLENATRWVVLTVQMNQPRLRNGGVRGIGQIGGFPIRLCTATTRAWLRRLWR
jgi:hypothetical protein